MKSSRALLPMLRQGRNVGKGCRLVIAIRISLQNLWKTIMK